MGACHATAVRAAGRVAGRPAPRRGRALLVALVVGLVMLLGGCQLRVATDIVVEVDGSGSATMRLVIDEELDEALQEAEVDPFEGLDAVAEGADWEVERVEDDGGRGLELSTSFATPEQLGRRVAELSAGLTEDDGALLRDVELVVTEDGAYEFTATGGIDPPRVIGSLPLDEGAVRFDGDDLAAALRDGGGELARHDLRVTFPTVPESAQATVESTSATWQLPNHELQTVSATAPPLPLDRRVVLLAAVGLGAAVVVAFVVRIARRRRR